MDTPLHTIGHGNRSAADVLDLLIERDVEYVVDVRSFPYSKRFPEFSQKPFRDHLKRRGIRYLFLGAELGGRPDDPDVYVDGKVSYDLAADRREFKAGLERIVAAVAGGHRACLVCSELRPETCHRTKLVAEQLVRRGVDVVHIDRDGHDASHETVMGRICHGQLALVGAATGMTSVGTYHPNGQRA